METNKIIGENIRALRKKSNYNQEVFSDYLGISREELSYYETGRRTTPGSVLSKLASLYGIDEYDLFEEDNVLNTVNIALAYRTDEENVDGLIAIAKFRRIVTNYIKMKRVLQDEDK